MKILDFDGAYRRILEVKNAPKEGVERTRTLIERVGVPHGVGNAVHVAGTNGKGSTVAFCDAILRAHGGRIGRCTSPHLMHVTERIAINGRDIDDDAFCRHEAAIAEVARTMPDPPTFFERIFALACLHFREQGIDAGVIEVGLGGRLDATNVITPRVSVIAPIALDHTRFLGNDIATIAAEKAAIIKRGVPAVSAAQHPDAAAVIAARAIEMDAPLFVVGRDLHVLRGAEGLRFVDAAGEGRASVGALGLAGAHQVDNAALAILALDAAGFTLERACIERALTGVRWPGRFEVLQSDAPRVIADGAHNPHAAMALRAVLDAKPPSSGGRVFVVGATRGHDVEAFASALSAQSAPVLATMSSAPRSLEADEVRRGFVAAGYADVRIVDVENAVADARSRAGAHGEVVITGSLYLVGELRRAAFGGRADPMVQGF